MKNKFGVKKERSKAVLKKLPYENATDALADGAKNKT